MPVKKRKKRRLGSSANGCHRRRAQAPNDVWCWDFVFDRTVSGSQLKWLSVVDEYTRECLTLKVDRGITSEDVIDTLSELFATRGVPRHIRSDNGPEFIAQTYVASNTQRPHSSLGYPTPAGFAAACAASASAKASAPAAHAGSLGQPWS